jgi:hypothetical protein
MNVIFPMPSPPQQDSRLRHRMDRLLTTNNTLANDTATSIMQDKGIVTPRTQPLLDKGTVVLDRLHHKRLCSRLIGKRTRTTYACGLLEARQQLRLSLANVSHKSMPAPSLVVLEPTSPWTDIDAGTSSPRSARHPEIYFRSSNWGQTRRDERSTLASSACAWRDFLGLPGLPLRWSMLLSS